MSRTRTRPPTSVAAVLQGKLGKVKRSEDLLTAIAFGTLAWMPMSLGLGRVLGSMSPKPTWTDTMVSVSIELWPWWNEAENQSGAEPDVVLTLERTVGAPVLLVVECKRGSSLGHQQLLRQAASGQVIAKQRGLHFGGLIYLTEHVGEPTSELMSAKAELREHLADAPPVWWVSWRDLGPVFDGAARQLEATTPMLAAACEDAAACLRRWGIVRYQGLDQPLVVPGWTFAQEAQ